MAMQAFDQSAFGQKLSRPIAIRAEIRGGEGGKGLGDQKSSIVTEPGNGWVFPFI